MTSSFIYIITLHDEFMGQVFLFSIESFFGQFFYLQSVLRKSRKKRKTIISLTIIRYPISVFLTKF